MYRHDEYEYDVRNVAEKESNFHDAADMFEKSWNFSEHSNPEVSVYTMTSPHRLATSWRSTISRQVDILRQSTHVMTYCVRV